MSYLVWRQHHRQLLFASLVLGVLAIILVPTGMHLASSMEVAKKTCVVTQTCGNLGDLLQNYGLIFDLIGFTAVAPALFGMFWGAPLVASEIEAGTQQLAWTQTVTRRRWLAVKLGWILAAAVVWGMAISALVTWWSGPANAVNQYRFDLGHFDTQGVVPVAYAIFAVALGVTVGIVVRRSLPALALTLGLFAGVRFAVDYLLRPHYLAPLTKILPLGSQAPVSPGSYWTINRQMMGPFGHPGIDIKLNLSSIPSVCTNSIGKGSDALSRCLGAHGWNVLTVYQPADRFWMFQAIETGLYVLLAGGLIAVAFFILQRRDV